MDSPTRNVDGQRCWKIDAIVEGLRAQRAVWRADHQRNAESNQREFPSRETVSEVVRLLSAALFPLRLGPPDLRRDGEDVFIAEALQDALDALVEQVHLELGHPRRHTSAPIADDDGERQACKIVGDFAAALPALRARLDGDVEAAFRGDPAAGSVDEVLLCYPGVLAMIHHRLGHELYRLGVPLIARMTSELAHSQTGIDIHPGATIGKRFFIDHGTGVVIGETAVIGDDVRVYQHVTLGAKRFATEDDGSLVKGIARHPIVEDGVVIYAGATILGRVTIGANSTIGGNVWLTRSVPPGSQITQAQSEHTPG